MNMRYEAKQGVFSDDTAANGLSMICEDVLNLSS